MLHTQLFLSLPPWRCLSQIKLHKIMEETDAQVQQKKRLHPGKHKQLWVAPTLQELKAIKALTQRADQGFE